jgi:hypothetical protein
MKMGTKITAHLLCLSNLPLIPTNPNPNLTSPLPFKTRQDNTTLTNQLSLQKAGLERTFRLLQAIAQILSSYALPFDYLLLFLAFISGSSSGTGIKSSSSPPDAATTRAVLLSLRTRFALGRRYLRLFRFLESFAAAQRLYVLASSPPLSSSDNKPRRALSEQRQNPRGPSYHPLALLAESEPAILWVDIFGRTFNGMYLLLEASTFLDAQRIPDFAIWGAETEAEINVEAQRLWLCALVCGVLAGLLRIGRVLTLAYADMDADVGDEDKGKGSAVPEQSEKASTDGDRDSKKGDSTLECTVWTPEVRSNVYTLGRRVVADALDITLPGAVVGWVPAGSGTVGLAMLVTSVLTGMEVWERCGQEVIAGNTKKK